MNSRNVVRFVIDAALTIILIAEMFIEFTGVFLHEVIGFAFFATVVVHLALSAKWIKNTAKAAKRGKMTGRRAALAVVGSLLGITIIVMGVSSVAISNILADAGFTWPLGSYALWANIHSISAYAFCAIVVIHLAMHWVFFAKTLRIPYDPSRRRAIGTGVHVAAAVGALALGAMALREVVPQPTIANGNTPSNESTADNSSSGSTSSAGSSGGTTSGSASNGSAAGSSSNSSTGSSDSSKRKDKTRGASGSTGDSSSSDATNPSSAPSSTSSSSSPSATGSSNDSTSSSSAESGICTICRKRCSLSDPKCNKPYEQGLI